MMVIAKWSDERSIVEEDDADTPQPAGALSRTRARVMEMQPASPRIPRCKSSTTDH
jgi:hypothetical protein